jgi:hypothetical protein
MYIDIGSSAAGSAGALVAAGACVGAAAGACVAAPPQAARTMLASTKAADKTYKFLRIFSFLLVVIFIHCHVINLLLRAMEERVNIWLIKIRP